MNNIDVRYKYIDLAYLDLMADGDVEMKMTMLEMLFEEPLQEFHKMKELVTTQNYEELKAISHKMKSTLAFVGNESLTANNKKVEEIAITETETEKLPTLVDSLISTYQEAAKELKAEYQAIA